MNTFDGEKHICFSPFLHFPAMMAGDTSILFMHIKKKVIVMYQVLLISENRILIKKVYQMIVDPDSFRIQVVPFSMDAFEAFYQVHADIIILDTTVFLPYEHLLEQFKQCNWHFYLILLGNHPFAMHPLETPCISLEIESLSKEVFTEIFHSLYLSAPSSFTENINVAFKWDKTYNISLSPDAYHLCLIQCYDKSTAFLDLITKTLIDNTSGLCSMHYVGHVDTTALFYINRSSITCDFHFMNLSDIIFQTFGARTSIQYFMHINWKKMSAEIPVFLSHIPYFYFLLGQSIPVKELVSKVENYKFHDLKEQCCVLFSYLLNHDILGAKHILQDMYSHIIKERRSFFVLNYIRLQINFCYFIFYGKKFHFQFECVEDELKSILNSELFLPLTFSSSRVQEILALCFTTVYNQFQNPISLDGIAMELNLNKIYLNKLFKIQFHRTILDVLQLLRIQQSKFELIFTDKKISDIAKESGFSDAGYFSKVFKKVTGLSAIEFRELKDGAEELIENYESIMEIS